MRVDTQLVPGADKSLAFLGVRSHDGAPESAPFERPETEAQPWVKAEREVLQKQHCCFHGMIETLSRDDDAPNWYEFACPHHSAAFRPEWERPLGLVAPVEQSSIS